MAESLGTIKGQMILDVRSALNAYTSARQAHISTVTALHTGAGAMTASGAAIAGVGAAMAAGLIVAVKAAADFERKLDFFVAVSGATQDEYQAISDKALQLGADTIFTANEIADSFIELGKSGVKASDIINGIGEAVANLGAAADIPLDTAANIITSAVATFQLGADQAVAVADKLAGAANASIVDVQDLGLSLKYVGGVAQGLGIPFEEVNTALAVLGVNGIKGSTAGTSLRQILLGLNGTTKKANTALRALGIITEDGTNKFYDEAGSAKSLAEIFQILQEATAGMTDEQRVATYQQIFATRALPSLIALTREGADGFNEMAAAINQTTAMDVASARLDNLSGDIEKLRGAIDVLLVKGGTGFQDFARGVVQGITDMIQGFIALPGGLQTAILSITGITGVILILIGTFGMLAGSMLNIIALGLQLKPAIEGLVGIFNALRVAIASTTAAQWAYNAATLANPIGLIIVAIVALIAGIALLIIYWEDFSNFINGSPWAPLIGAINPILGIATAIALLQKQMADHKTELESFWNVVVDVWNNIVSFFVTVAGNIGSFFTDAFNGLVSFFQGIPGFFQGIWNDIIGNVSAFIATIVTFFQELPGKIAAFVSAIPGIVGQFFAELPGRIGYALGFILGTIVRVFLEIGQWLFTNVPLIIGNVLGFFQNMQLQINQFFTDILNGIINIVLQIGIWLATNVPLIINNIVTFFQELPGKIVQFFTDVYNGIITWWLNIAAWVVTNVPIMINNIIAFFRELPGKIIQFFIDIYNNVRKWMSDVLNSAIKIATDIFKGIQNALAGLPALVSGIFNNVVQAIKNAISGAVKAVTQFATGLWNGFKDGLGIHSPSYIERAMWQITGVVEDETTKLAKQVGTIQDLGNGITEMGNSLGNGFGDNLDKNVSSLYSQLDAMKNVQANVALGSTAAIDPSKNMLSNITSSLAGISKDGVGETTFNVEINNPEPEPTSESLPTAIRKVAYMLD